MIVVHWLQKNTGYFLNHKNVIATSITPMNPFIIIQAISSIPRKIFRACSEVGRQIGTCFGLNCWVAGLNMRNLMGTSLVHSVRPW